MQDWRSRGLLFALFGLLSLAVCWKPLQVLLTLSVRDEQYSHIVFIPIISLCLVCLQRKNIFLQSRYCPTVGITGLVLAMGIYFLQAELSSLNQNDRMSVAVCALVLVWISNFILCYGLRSFHAALFPLLFLFLMIPIPTVLHEKIVFALQKGSAVATYALFRLLHVPVLWEGFRFSLPGFDIEIAKECSGIRSTLAFLITGILAGHIFLRSSWKKLALVVATVPIAIFKNGVRIVTISSLGIYVDRSYLTGELHHRGGVVFSVLAFAIFVPLLLALQNSENRPQVRTVRGSTSAAGDSGAKLSPHAENV